MPHARFDSGTARSGNVRHSRRRFTCRQGLPPAKKKAPPAKDDSPLQVGKNLPGPFHPYNVTGPHKQHFHCLVSEHDVDPMVMIFHKNVDFADPLANLLKKIDSAIDKIPMRVWRFRRLPAG